MKAMILIFGLAASALPGAAYADPNKDESGPARWRGDRPYGYYDRYGYDDDRKVKFYTRDGCTVERKWKKGEYEEKVKCKRWGRYGYRD